MPDNEWHGYPEEFWIWLKATQPNWFFPIILTDIVRGERGGRSYALQFHREQIEESYRGWLIDTIGKIQDPTERAKAQQDWWDKYGMTTYAGQINPKLPSFEQYFTAVNNWIKTLQLKGNLPDEYAQKMREDIRAQYQGNTPLYMLPYYDILVSDDDIDRDLEIKRVKDAVSKYEAELKEYEKWLEDTEQKAAEQAWKEQQAAARADYLDRVVLSQSNVGAANDYFNWQRLRPQLPSVSDEDLFDMLGTVIGQPREEVLAEIQRRQEAFGDKTSQRQMEQTQRAVEGALEMIRKEPNNPVAAQILYQSGYPIEKMTPMMRQGLEEGFKAEEQARRLSEFVPGEMPMAEESYFPFVENLPIPLQKYYRKNIGSVYREFQATGGDKLMEEWWQTVAPYRAGAVQAIAQPYGPTAGTQRRAEAAGLSVEKYLETATQYMERPESADFSQLSREELIGLEDAYNEYQQTVTLPYAGEQERIKQMKEQKSPWAKFLETYHWGASPYERGSYPGVYAPPARWR